MEVVSREFVFFVPSLCVLACAVVEYRWRWVSEAVICPLPVIIVPILTELVVSFCGIDKVEGREFVIVYVTVDLVAVYDSVDVGIFEVVVLDDRAYEDFRVLNIACELVVFLFIDVDASARDVI